MGLPIKNGLDVIKIFNETHGVDKLPPILLLSAFAEAHFNKKNLNSLGIKYNLRKPP